MKKDLQRIKDACQKIKSEIAEFEKKSLEAKEAGSSTSPAYYTHAFGPIRYNKVQRQKWETKTAAIFKAHGLAFNPAKAPTTDMEK